MEQIDVEDSIQTGVHKFFKNLEATSRFIGTRKVP
jgi:hypothetical protein